MSNQKTLTQLINENYLLKNQPTIETEITNIVKEWLTQKLEALQPQDCLTSNGSYWKIEKTAKTFVNELLVECEK